MKDACFCTHLFHLWEGSCLFEAVDQFFEYFAAMLEVLEHIKACTGRGKQYVKARLCLILCADHTFLKAAVNHRVILPAALICGLLKSLRSSADKHGVLYFIGKGFK